MIKFVVSIAALLIGKTSAHGSMRFPSPRQSKLEPQQWFNQGCQPGCGTCSDTFGYDTCSESNGTMAPTLNDAALRTYNTENKDGDWTAIYPWRAPGFSPIFSPCGLAGGGNTYHPANGANAPDGVEQGADGRALPPIDNHVTWKAGTKQNVSWTIVANHGGGYAYRLCKKDAKQNNLTEECFQDGHLRFSGDTSWVRYFNNSGDAINTTAFKPVRVGGKHKDGGIPIRTQPPNSEWTKNPVPACAGSLGGVGEAVCNKPYQFDELVPGVFGYGPATCFTGAAGAGEHCTREQSEYWEEKFNFEIIDEVILPEDLEAGDYVMSFRWDCEQTPQVWTQCADITVTSA